MKVSHKGRRVKGSIGEREVVEIFNAAGFPARRVPLSGAAAAFPGDVLVDLEPGDNATEVVLEIKRRAQGFKKIDQYLDDAYAVVYRRDRGEWSCTLRLADMLDLIKGRPDLSGGSEAGPPRRGKGDS